MVICQHGIVDSACCWVLNGKDSIGFRLVDLGFDVWLNNGRGSKYSKEHQWLDTANDKLRSLPEIKEQQKEYYDFSFHEMGLYDQPALWKFIINETGQEKISYVCHS